jgi:hypothetical protein
MFFFRSFHMFFLEIFLCFFFFQNGTLKIEWFLATIWLYVTGIGCQIQTISVTTAYMTMPSCLSEWGPKDSYRSLWSMK